MFRFRPYHPSDAPALRSAFAGSSEPAGAGWLDAAADDLVGTVAVDALGPAGALLWQPERLWLGGRLHEATVVRVAARRPGPLPGEPLAPAARDLMATPGPVCHLLPIRAADEPGAGGLARLSSGWSLDLPPNPDIAGLSGSSLRPATRQDLDALKGIAERRHQFLAGPKVRSAQDWQTWFPTDDEPVVVLLSAGAEGPDGYLRLRYPADRAQVAVVEEWADLSPAALNGFLGYLGFLRLRGYTVHTAPIPADRPVLEHFGRQRLVRMQPVRTVALRPGLPDFFLPALRYGAGHGRVCLHVDDPLDLWPGRLTLEWREGALVGWSVGGERPDARMPLSAFVALAFGDLRPTEAADLGWLAPPAAELLERWQVWAPLPFYRHGLDDLPPQPVGSAAHG